jgi:hypothetical protein
MPREPDLEQVARLALRDQLTRLIQGPPGRTELDVVYALRPTLEGRCAEIDRLLRERLLKSWDSREKITVELSVHALHPGVTVLMRICFGDACSPLVSDHLNFWFRPDPVEVWPPSSETSHLVAGPEQAALMERAANRVAPLLPVLVAFAAACFDVPEPPTQSTTKLKPRVRRKSGAATTIAAPPAAAIQIRSDP